MSTIDPEPPANSVVTATIQVVSPTLAAAVGTPDTQQQRVKLVTAADVGYFVSVADAQQFIDWLCLEGGHANLWINTDGNVAVRLDAIEHAEIVQ